LKFDESILIKYAKSPHNIFFLKLLNPNFDANLAAEASKLYKRGNEIFDVID